MFISNCNAESIQAAADAIGVDVDMAPTSRTGKRHTVKLNLRYGWADDDGNKRYQRESHSGRRVHAVCWHGFRDFFRELFAREPQAVTRSAGPCTWTSENFESDHMASGRRNIGSRFDPMPYVAACRCPDSGELRSRPSHRAYTPVTA